MESTNASTPLSLPFSIQRFLADTEQQPPPPPDGPTCTDDEVGSMSLEAFRTFVQTWSDLRRRMGALRAEMREARAAYAEKSRVITAFMQRHDITDLNIQSLGKVHLSTRTSKRVPSRKVMRSRFEALIQRVAPNQQESAVRDVFDEATGVKVCTSLILRQ